MCVLLLYTLSVSGMLRHGGGAVGGLLSTAENIGKVFTFCISKKRLKSFFEKHCIISEAVIFTLI